MQLQEGKIKHHSSSLVFVETRNTLLRNLPRHSTWSWEIKTPACILPSFQTFKFTSEVLVSASELTENYSLAFSI